MLSGKSVLIGITGGIASYKVCELIRMYKKANAEVYVVCTPNALNFVTETTLKHLSKNDVAVEEFDIKAYNPKHISLADKCDIMVIAPATANTISKIASGISDNLLTSVACAFKKPVIIAPAMNCNMWENPIIQGNTEKLKKLGYSIIEPETGYLACGYEGKGRLCDLKKIFDKTVELLAQNTFLKGKTVLITSGGTIENIDTVRYISNFSSGKMGLALADEAYKMGALVKLVTTCDVERNYEVIKVRSAEDMKNAVFKEADNANCIIMAAAVADYRVKEQLNHKMKKTSDDEITLTLVKNPDILKELASRPHKNEQIIAGFCAESENLLENAKVKIKSKGCDYLIANDISRKDTGFSSDYNEVLILDRNGNVKHLEKATKNAIARQIFEEIYG